MQKCSSYEVNLLFCVYLNILLFMFFKLRLILFYNRVVLIIILEYSKFPFYILHKIYIYIYIYIYMGGWSWIVLAEHSFFGNTIPHLRKLLKLIQMLHQQRNLLSNYFVSHTLGGISLKPECNVHLHFFFFSGHGNSIQNIIPLLKEKKMCPWAHNNYADAYFQSSWEDVALEVTVSSVKSTDGTCLTHSG